MKKGFPSSVLEFKKNTKYYIGFMIPFTYITLKHTNQNNNRRVGIRLKIKEKGLNKGVRIRKRIKEVGLE